MIITADTLTSILYGSSLLGGGGGGRLELARELMGDIRQHIPLVSYDSLDPSAMSATVFGLGGLKKRGEMRFCMQRCLNLFQQRLGRAIDYLIPVEIGPLAVMNVLYMADISQKPVIDADVVGYRSAPELYLETITMMNVDRCPLVATNSEGEVLIIEHMPDPYRLETIMRKFSEDSKSNVYVAGYPLLKRELAHVGLGSVSYSHEVGMVLTKTYTDDSLSKNLANLGCIFIDQGQIIDQQEVSAGGFTSGKLIVQCGVDIYVLVYCNEFLVLLKNGKEIITCPDSILLLDTTSCQGINNGDDNKNKHVMILARKSIALWRSQKGCELFSPQNLGLPYQQKLIDA